MNRQQDQQLSARISRNLDSNQLSKPVDTPPRNGACLGYDVSMWFPYFEKEVATREIYKSSQENSARAKKICFSCHAQMECLAYGLQNELWGIWGGYTERERKSLRRRFGIKLVKRDSIINISGMNLKYE